MLFALISIAWLAAMTLIWAVCRMARRGDKSPPSANLVNRSGPPTGDGLVIWEDLLELSLKDARRPAEGAPAHSAGSQPPASHDVPLTAPGVR